LYSYHSDTMTPPPPSSALFPYATLFRSLQQFRVAESDCGKLFGSEIPVTEHPLETVHIDVCDVAHHQDGLLHLAGVLDQIVHRFEGIVILLALLIDFHRLLKVAHHVRGGLGGMDDVFGGIDDALR